MLYIGFEPFPSPRTSYLNFTSIALFRGTLKYLSGSAKLDSAEKTAAKVTDDTKEEPDMLDVIAILNMAS